MKRVLSLLTLMLFVVAIGFAQTTKPNPEQYLTKEQLDKYNQDLKIAELEKKLQTYGNWVGIGGEIGDAVKEGLSAVVDVADKFSGTNVGKFTMFMIAWKIMGDNIFGYMFGTLYFLISTIVFVRIFRRLIRPRKMVINDPGFLRYPKKCEIIPAPFDNEDSAGAASLIFAVVMFANIGITCAILF